MSASPALLPTQTWVEYIPQLEPITSSRLQLHKGQARPPETPGLGIEWDWASIAQRSIATLEVK